MKVHEACTETVGRYITFASFCRRGQFASTADLAERTLHDCDAGTLLYDCRMRHLYRKQYLEHVS